MSRKVIKLKVSKNIYGNYRGFVTGQQSVELGCSEFNAIEWLEQKLIDYPEAVISDKSYITLNDVLKFRIYMA